MALVFLTSSSIDQTVTAGNTWSQIVITFLGAGACAAVVLVGGRGRAWGAGTVALLAAFTAFAALSILWSVQPDWSWFGANQLLSYLAAFAGAVALGRLAPRRWPALVGGLATAMAALCIYALLAKVFPRRWRPPTTTGGCSRRLATGTPSGWPPLSGSRRRCGRPPGPRARRSCAR